MAKYSEVLFRHKIRFGILLLIALVVATAVAVQLASFRATATLSVADPSSFGATFVPVGWSQDLTPAQNVADASAVALKTDGFSRDLAAGLSASGATSSPAQMRQILDSLPSSLKVAVAGSHLVALSYTCSNGGLCVRVLTAAVTALRQQLIQTEQDQAAATTAFWTAQLTDAQANLASAQSDLQAYGKANPGVSTDAGSTDPQVIALHGRINLWQGRVADAQNNLGLAQYSSAESARLIDLGTTVLTPPQLTSSGPLGDWSSLKPALLIVGFGVLVTVLYLVILAWVDQTVRDPRTIERRLGVPVVATIPRLMGSRGV